MKLIRGYCNEFAMSVKFPKSLKPMMIKKGLPWHPRRANPNRGENRKKGVL